MDHIKEVRKREIKKERKGNKEKTKARGNSNYVGSLWHYNSLKLSVSVQYDLIQGNVKLYPNFLPVPYTKKK